MGRSRNWFLSLLVFAGVVLIHLAWVDRISQNAAPGIFGSLWFGIVNATLLSLLFWSSLNTRQVAQRIAQKLTQDLNQKNEELSAVIDSFPGMISWVDEDLNYVGVNQRVAQLYGQNPEKFRGLPVGTLASADNAQEFRQRLEDFFQSSDLRRSFQWSQKSSGAETWFLTTLQKFHQNSKIMVVSIDITEQKLLEQEIEAARAKALHNARLSALGEMAGGMAHEINNPLMIIYAKATQLKTLLAQQNSPELNTAGVRLIEKIEFTSQRISKIIRGLRTIARDGERDPYQEVSLQSIINDTRELVVHRLKSKSIDLRLPPEMAPEELVDCRATQVVQVLLNLISNAMDAVENQNSPWIELKIRLDSEQVEFLVLDSGSGVPEDQRDKIMRPFYTTKEVGKGTGLGLSVSHGIAQAHNGSLFLDPSQDHTCFVLKIPRRQTSSGTNFQAA